MTPSIQRPLFVEPPSVTEAFLRSLEPPSATAPPSPMWVWLTGDFCTAAAPNAALRICCEPTSDPAPAAWLLTAWERVARGPQYCRYRDDLQYGQLNLRLPPANLLTGVERVRHLQASLADPDVAGDERQRVSELLTQTRRAVLLLWREDCLANAAAAVAAIHAAVPLAAEVGVVDGGAVLLDLEVFTPQVDSLQLWHALELGLRRPGRSV